MVQLSERQKDILIRTALGEARGEGVEGMADVIQVIFNRAQSGRFPADPAAVAQQPYQFSTWNRGEGGNNPQQFKKSDPIYKKAEQALEAVASGSRPDYTGGALFYHTPAVNPNWSGEVNKFGTVQRNGHIFYPSRPVPPGEIPNTVASRLDTTPQTRNVPLPRPRPQQRMVQGTSQAPTSAASRAFPTLNATPRLAPQGDGIFAYTPPDMQPAQIAAGRGSLTPDFFRSQPRVRLPEIAPPSGYNRLDAMAGIPSNVMRQELSLQGQSYAAQDAARRSGVATRVVPSVPVSQPRPTGPALSRDSVAQAAAGAAFRMPTAVPGPNAAPKLQDRLPAGVGYPSATAMGIGAVYPMMQQSAPQAAVAPRPVVGFPTPVQQRPAPVVGFPTPAQYRPSMAMAAPPLRVTVNGAGSYSRPSAPPPQTFQGASTGRTYTEGQRMKLGNDTVRANADGSFTNERTGRKVASGTGWQALHGLS